MPKKFDLKIMLEEIREDESAGAAVKGQASQDLIRKMMAEKMKKKRDDS